MLKTRHGLALLAALTLSLTACGGGGSADDAKAEKNIKAAILKDNSLTGGSAMTDKQATCVAHGAVSKLGTDKLVKYKLLNKDLSVNSGNELGNTKFSSGDADQMAGVFVDCVDIKKLFTDTFESQGSLTDSQKKCLSDALTSDVIKEFLSKSLQQDSAAQSALTTKLQTCLTA